MCWERGWREKDIRTRISPTNQRDDRVIRKRLVTAQDRQREYAYQDRKDEEYDDWRFVRIKVFPCKGLMRFGSKGVKPEID